MRRVSSTGPIEILQWFGLLAGGLAWAAQLVIGFGFTVADCSPAGSRWGLDRDTWEVATTAGAALIVLSAEAAAILVFLATRETTSDDPPPRGRWHFFAAGSIAANLLFLAIVLLSGLASLSFDPCRQA